MVFLQVLIAKRGRSGWVMRALLRNGAQGERGRGGSPPPHSVSGVCHCHAPGSGCQCDGRERLWDVEVEG